MITLTNAAIIKSVLGGVATATYDKFIISSVTFNPVSKLVQANIRITSTALPDMQAITGNLTVNPATATLTIEVGQLDFYRQLKLTTPQNDIIVALVRSTQNSLESGLISIGVIDGVQQTGD